jgi:hypothetical protein
MDYKGCDSIHLLKVLHFLVEPFIVLMLQYFVIDLHSNK